MSRVMLSGGDDVAFTTTRDGEQFAEVWRDMATQRIRRIMSHQRWYRVGILSISSSLLVMSSAIAQRQLSPLRGTLHRIIGDPSQPNDPALERWVLSTDRGALVPVQFASPAQRATATRYLNTRVTLSTSAPSRDSSTGRLIQTIAPDVATAAALTYGPEVAGNRPWIVLLCQLAGDQPFATPAAIRGLLTSETTGMRNYFREVSGDRFTAEMAVTDRWYALPKSEAGYGGAARFDLFAATQDCLGAVDPDVNFPDFSGIILQFSGSIGASGFGGAVSLVLDGLARRYGVAWIAGGAPTLAPYAPVYAHEIGHGLGLLHSYQKIGADYGSTFDVMSGTLLVHPIAYQKSILGWIAPERIRTIGAADRGVRMALTRLARPPNTQTPVMLRVPLSPRSFLTIEARQRIGYDDALVNTGVVVHHVARHRGVMEALMLDSNTDPDDGGIGWRVGQRFEHATFGVRFSIDSIVGSETWLTILDMPAAPRTFTLAMQAAGAGMIRESGGSPTAVCGTTCTATFIDGEVVSLDADADAGNVFSGWSGDCSGPVCTVTVTRDLSVRATFAPAPTVAIALTGRGRVVSDPNGIFCDWRSAFGLYQQCGATFVPGEIALNAAADSAHFFDRFVGATCGTSTQCRLTPTTNLRIAALFAPGPTLHTRIVGPGGVFSPRVGGNAVDCYFDGGNTGCHPGFRLGTRVQLAAQTFSFGYRFVAWTGACVGADACAIDMDTSRTVGAVFANGPTVFAYDSLFVRTAAFRAPVAFADSSRIALGGPGATQWRASASRSALQLARASGQPFAWLVWNRIPAALVPGWNVDSIRVTADGSSALGGLIIDSVLVRADATLTQPRAVRVDTLVVGAPSADIDSVAVRFTGRDSLLIPWAIADWSARFSPIRRIGVGDGFAVWQRRWSSLPPGLYGDSLVIRAEGARNGAWLIRDTVLIIGAPSRARVIADVLGGAPLSRAERDWMDQLGNRDRTFNLGDVLALLSREL